MSNRQELQRGLRKSYSRNEASQYGRRRRLWYEYQIPADFGKQMETIRKLRKWIQQLENDKRIVGFAFNHYWNFPTKPEEPDELRIRFEYSDQKHKEGVEKELEIEVKKLLPNYIKTVRDWDSPQHVLQAYEFGSRCAFLSWELIENKRFTEEYFSQFYVGENENGIIVRQIPLEFQTHFNHGVMNSLGIPKYPNERFIHLNHMLDSTGSKNKQELIKWLQENLKGQ